jgi:hypothetical protein
MDTQLQKELATFMYAFENVFIDEWDRAQLSMGIPPRDQKEDFLVHDNYTDWAGHNALVTHYKRRKKEMAAQNVSIDELS